MRYNSFDVMSRGLCCNKSGFQAFVHRAPHGTADRSLSSEPLLHIPAREAGAPHQQSSPRSTQRECLVGAALTPRTFGMPEPPWPATGSLLESCSQRNLTLSAL